MLDTLKTLERKFRDELLSEFKYRDLVELRLLVNSIQENEGKLYQVNFQNGFYIFNPIHGNYITLSEEDTRIWIRNLITKYRDLLSQSSSYEEFFSSLSSQSDELESNYNGSFSIDLYMQLILDEATALRANAMVFDGKSEEEIKEFILKNNKSKYVYIPDSFLGLTLKTGHLVDGDSDDIICSSIGTQIEDGIIVDIDALIDELSKFGFRMIAYVSKNVYSSDIKSSLINLNGKETMISLVDTTLEHEEVDEAYIIFPNQKSKKM